MTKEQRTKGEEEIVSQDGLLTLDPKKRIGQLTLEGKRIDEPGAKGSPDEIEKLISPGKDEKEN